MNNFLPLIQEVYPQDYHKVQQALSHTLYKQRLSQTKELDWHKNLQLYVVYPDTFHDGWKAGFDELTQKLDHIKNLGCNAIHVLPFLSSPQIDAGFDISEYYLIRENLGGNIAFERFLDACQEKELSVFMDLVLNHISYQHRWFSQAVSGDRFYRKFFYTSWDQPQLLQRYSNEIGEWAAYETADGRLDIRIIFPEQAGEIPHWYQAEDGYWYYHTFYPQQLDVNWNNYHVFVAFAKVLSYWAKKGLNFRLDAIPFVGKEIKPGLIETSPKTHQLVSAMHSIVKTVAPDSVFLVEANQSIEKMLDYFGSDSQTGEIRIESELAYNFPLMNQTWAALLSQKPEPIITCLDQTTTIPSWASWVTFLRNHDELTLEFADENLQQLIHEQLNGRGSPFRGDHDVSGRTMSLLGGDPAELIFAYFLLASLPGCPAIIYGDEIGKLNDLEFMKQQTEYKRSWFHLPEIQDDTRDINRGFIDQQQLAQPQAQTIYQAISTIYKQRAQYIANHKLQSYKSYKTHGLWLEYKKVTAIINLGRDSMELDDPDKRLITSVGEVEATGTEYKLSGRAGVWVEKS